MPHDPIDEIRDLVERSLQQTEEALEGRKKLTRRFLKEIGQEVAEAKKALDRLGDPWKHGEESLQYEAQRIALDKAMTARKKDRRAELLRDWSDRIRLAEKRVELLRELNALTNR